MAVKYTVEVLSNSDVAMPAKAGQATSSVVRFIDQLKGVMSGMSTGTTLNFLQSAVSASGSITLASVAAGTVVAVNGVRFIAVNTTAATAASGEFDITGNNTAAAIS